LHLGSGTIKKHMRDSRERTLAELQLTVGCLRLPQSQRVFIHEQVYDQVRAKLIEGAKKLNERRGHPLEATTFLGPMVAESEAIRVERMVRESVDSHGAKVLVGGKRTGSFHGTRESVSVRENSGALHGAGGSC